MWKTTQTTQPFKTDLKLSFEKAKLIQKWQAYSQTHCETERALIWVT